MQYINDPRHESAQQSPMPTRNQRENFGAGTLAYKDSGAGMVERTLQVEITNPSMRTQQTAPVREEKQRLTARTMDVVARSGNQRPGEVDQRIPDNFIWGMAGEGEAPVASPAAALDGLLNQRNLMIAGAAVAAYFFFLR